jgi:hypothetical protein
VRRSWGGLDKYAPIGLHVVGHDDKVIGSFACRYVAAGEQRVEVLLRFLDDARTKAGPLPERKVAARPLKPDRGSGLRPDGSARLAVTVRALRDGRPVNARPVFESAYLSAKQLTSLAPPQAKVGARYVIPKDTARQLTTALTDDGDDVFTIRPHEATAARIQAEVTAVSADRVEVRLSGELAGKRENRERLVEAKATVDGRLVFNRKGDLQSLLIVTDGRYRSPWAKSAHSVGGLLEWGAR